MRESSYICETEPDRGGYNRDICLANFHMSIVRKNAVSGQVLDTARSSVMAVSEL